MFEISCATYLCKYFLYLMFTHLDPYGIYIGGNEILPLLLPYELGWMFIIYVYHLPGLILLQNPYTFTQLFFFFF